MSKNISEKDVSEILAPIKHPVIESNLVNLGIIKDISVNADIITITMAFPFIGISAKDISIRDQVINSVREVIKKLAVKVDLKQTEMEQEELQAFLAKEQETWESMV